LALSTQPAYGFKPNVTSWGGNVIKNDEGGYDMWVSEMVGGTYLFFSEPTPSTLMALQMWLV
jgi:hypothetical protein